jgi:hypothetical protein
MAVLKAFKRGDLVNGTRKPAACEGSSSEARVEHPPQWLRAREEAMSGTKTLESDAFVFFGATGDLAFRQIIVADGGWHNPSSVAQAADVATP